MIPVVAGSNPVGRPKIFKSPCFGALREQSRQNNDYAELAQCLGPRGRTKCRQADEKRPRTADNFVAAAQPVDDNAHGQSDRRRLRRVFAAKRHDHLGTNIRKHARRDY